MLINKNYIQIYHLINKNKVLEIPHVVTTFIGDSKIIGSNNIENLNTTGFRLYIFHT